MLTLTFWHYSGGHPVPRAKSLYDGSLINNVKRLLNPRFLSSLLACKIYFLADQTGLFIGISHPRPVKDSDPATLRQAEIPCRHTSERIQGTILSPVRAYLALFCLVFLKFANMRTMYTHLNMTIIIVI